MDRGAWRQSDRTEKLTLHFQREGEKVGGEGRRRKKRKNKRDCYESHIRWKWPGPSTAPTLRLSHWLEAAWKEI